MVCGGVLGQSSPVPGIVVLCHHIPGPPSGPRDDCVAVVERRLRRPSKLSFPLLEHWLVAGFSAASLLVVSWSRPQVHEVMSAGGHYLAFLVLLRVPLLLAMWRVGCRPAIGPAVSGTWLLGWLSSFFLIGLIGRTEKYFVMLDGPLINLPPMLLLLCFFGVALILGSCYRTLAAELHARRVGGVISSAIIVMAAEALLAIWAWERAFGWF